MKGRVFPITPREAGSTLLVALTMIATLSLISGAFVVAVTSRTKTAYESASWREAALAAESGANLALAEIRRVMPDLNRPVSDPWSGWTSSTGTLPTGREIPAGVTLSYIPPVLTHAGQGNTTLSARVTLDAPAGLTTTGHQWLRLRSQGTALVPGVRRVSPDKMDNRLRRLAYFRDAALGEATARPQVTRTVEMIVRPVLPFESAIRSAGDIAVHGSRALVDSFDSSTAAGSTGGEYDSAKRRTGGNVSTNGDRLVFWGRIYGNVGTNNGDVGSSNRISGTIDNNSYRPLPEVSEPGWTIATTAGATLSATGGTKAAPRRYKVSNVSGELRITTSGPGVAEVWVDGHVNGTIRIDADVEAQVYVDGNINLSSDLRNDNERAEKLVIYGVSPINNANRQISMPLTSEVHAAIYAPRHDLRVSGSNDFMGSLAVRSLQAVSSARFHYDEALSLRTGRVIDYRIASWVEEVL